MNRLVCLLLGHIWGQLSVYAGLDNPTPEYVVTLCKRCLRVKGTKFTKDEK